MKALVVGGAAQGKKDYVRRELAPTHWMDGSLCPLEDAFSGDALDNLHLLIRRLIEQGLEPGEWMRQAMEPLAGWIILCDEVGSGVVPIDAFERDWREQVGRICCAIAARSDRVERLCCGLSQRLK